MKVISLLLLPLNGFVCGLSVQDVHAAADAMIKAAIPDDDSKVLVPGKGDLSHVVPDLVSMMPAPNVLLSLGSLFGSRAVCPGAGLGGFGGPPGAPPGAAAGGPPGASPGAPPGDAPGDDAPEDPPGGDSGAAFDGGGGAKAKVIQKRQDTNTSSDGRPLMDGDCWKYCNKAITQAHFCTGMHICSCSWFGQSGMMLAVGDCNECYKQSKNGDIQLNMEGATMFMENEDFFDNVVQYHFWHSLTGCGADGGGGTSNCPPVIPPIQPPPPPPPPPEPEPEPQPSTDTGYVTNTDLKVIKTEIAQGHVTRVKTLVKPPPPPKHVIITRHVTRTQRDPNACYGDNCLKTVTGFITTTKSYRVPGKTVTGESLTYTITLPPKQPGAPAEVKITTSVSMKTLNPGDQVLQTAVVPITKVNAAPNAPGGGGHALPTFTSHAL